MRKKRSLIEQIMTWIVFFAIWFFWSFNCLTTFLAFEFILSHGGLQGNIPVKIMGRRIPTRDLLSIVFAGIIEAGSIGAAVFIKKRHEEASEVLTNSSNEILSISKYLNHKSAKGLFTTAQTSLFAFTLSLVLSSNNPSNVNTFPENTVQSSPNPTSQENPPSQTNPLILAVIIFMSPSAAIVMTWVTPELALEMSERVIDIYRD
jgi:hypothetical protein